MSILKTLFGKDKIVDSIINGADSIIYTEEEKKENFKSFLTLYEPFKVAQRYLAVIFSVPFVVLHIGAYSLRIAFWDNQPLQDAVKVIQDDMNESLGLPVALIIGFYFAGGAAEGVAKKFFNRG